MISDLVAFIGKIYHQHFKLLFMTKKSDNKQTQPRKQYCAAGERTSKMMAFRADRDVIRWLNHAANKGRLINELVRSWAKQQPFYDEDASPDENMIEEYMT